MKKRTTRFFLMLLCAVILTAAIPVRANADMGPKPSVRITFENLGDELCYATLLSSRSSTGPASAWNGQGEARHNENPNYAYKSFGYDVWKAFVGYAENDDFYFLQEAWQVNETKELAWTYLPPSEFKILLYFPETGEFSVSEVYERYAFDSYFTVNMEGAKRSADLKAELTADEYLQVCKAYDYTAELISLVFRIVITILVETAIAVIFGFRKKKQLVVLFAVNAATQIVLNILLNIINYNSGAIAFVLSYILFEVIVFVIEAVLYCIVLKKISEQRKAGWFYVLYALVANAISFGAGLFVAKILPGIF